MTMITTDAPRRERSLTSAAMIGDLEGYRIIDKKELRRYVPYSSHHVARLEAARAFPRRIKLGDNRVGWLLGEVLDWIEQRKLARAVGLTGSHKVLAFAVSETELNCLLDKKALRRFVPYTPQHVARLEARGLFPSRVQIGGNRVGWVIGELLEWIAERVRERDARLHIVTDEVIP